LCVNEPTKLGAAISPVCHTRRRGQARNHMKNTKSRAERETIIRRAQDEALWHVFSEDPAVVRSSRGCTGRASREAKGSCGCSKSRLCRSAARDERGALPGVIPGGLPRETSVWNQPASPRTQARGQARERAAPRVTP